MKIDLFSAQSQSIAIALTTSASTSTPLPTIGSCLRIVNDSTGTAYISVGSGTQTAVQASGAASSSATAILGGQDAVFSIPSDARLNISALVSTGTGTLVVSVGEGA